MQAYIEACEKNGIILGKTNSKKKSNIIIIAEDGKLYSVAKDMTVTEYKPSDKTSLYKSV